MSRLCSALSSERGASFHNCSLPSSSLVPQQDNSENPSVYSAPQLAHNIKCTLSHLGSLSPFRLSGSCSQSPLSASGLPPYQQHMISSFIASSTCLHNPHFWVKEGILLIWNNLLMFSIHSFSTCTGFLLSSVLFPPFTQTSSSSEMPTHLH